MLPVTSDIVESEIATFQVNRFLNIINELIDD